MPLSFGGGGGSSGGTQTPTTIRQVSYTATGAIDPTADRVIFSSSSPLSMTLAMGVANHTLQAIRSGTGTVNITANVNGKSTVIPLTGDISLYNETATFQVDATASTYYLT